MPLDDEPSADSERAVLERNVIALLSNLGGETVDPRPADWLGRHSQSAAIRGLGLWNVNHVEERHDPDVLDLLDAAVDETTTP